MKKIYIAAAVLIAVAITEGLHETACSRKPCNKNSKGIKRILGFTD
jgi:hypothetical protein